MMDSDGIAGDICVLLERFGVYAEIIASIIVAIIYWVNSYYIDSSK
jgi:hypothetical protein